MKKWLVRRLWQREEGSILIITALSITVLMAAGGAAYDFGRQQLVRLKLQQATDIASLAAGTMPQWTSSSDRRAEALRYYNLNFPPEFLGVERPTPSIDIGATASVSASTNMPTSFIEEVGNEQLAIKSQTRAMLNSSQRDFDLVVVVDESGSTRWSCASCGGLTIMQVERNALLAMLDIIFPAGEVNPNVRFGLIGYTQHISNKWGLTSNKAQAQAVLGNLRPRLLNYDHYGLEAGYHMITGTNMTGANGTIADVVKETSPDCSNSYGPLLPNPVWLVTPLKAGHPCIRTNGTCGMPSPPCRTRNQRVADRNTTVPPPQTARSDGELNSPVKNVVFITDGFIMVEPANCIDGPRGFGEHPISSPLRWSDCPNYSAFLQQCQRIKDAGATLFTISFASQGVGDEAALRACASTDPNTGNPRYLFAPDATTLVNHLQEIGRTVTKARVTQ